MKISPKAMFISYFILGILFTYMAIRFAGDSIWSFPTILLAVFATLEFGVGFRMLIIHLKLKKNKKE